VCDRERRGLKKSQVVQNAPKRKPRVREIESVSGYSKTQKR